MKTNKKIKQTKIKKEIVAKISINRMGDFTPKGAKEVSAWLRKCAADIQKHYKLWDKTGTSHFTYYAEK